MRYTDLDQHADCGLGADELDTARFTRPCERIELAQLRATKPEQGNGPGSAATDSEAEVHPTTTKELN